MHRRQPSFPFPSAARGLIFRPWPSSRLPAWGIRCCAGGRSPSPTRPDPEIHGLIADMLETHRRHRRRRAGRPTQVHVSLRVVIFEVPERRVGADAVVPMTALINPVIEPLDDAMLLGWESCLSVPG